MRGCHSPRSGRMTTSGPSRPQSTRIVQRKRRPTSKVDSPRTRLINEEERNGPPQSAPQSHVFRTGSLYMGENVPARMSIARKKADLDRPCGFDEPSVSLIGLSFGAAPAALIRCLCP
jgi:hypothetical protein